MGGNWPRSFHRYRTALSHSWTQKSASAYFALTTQRTASGPSSIVQPGRWSTHCIPRMTWSTRRSCLTLSSKGSPSSTSSTSSCPARSYPHWWSWPTSSLHKVSKSFPLTKYYTVIRLQDKVLLSNSPLKRNDPSGDEDMLHRGAFWQRRGRWMLFS